MIDMALFKVFAAAVPQAQACTLYLALCLQSAVPISYCTSNSIKHSWGTTGETNKQLHTSGQKQLHTYPPHTHTHTPSHTTPPTHTYKHTSKNTRIPINTYSHTSKHTCIPTDTHTRTSTHTHTHTHTHQLTPTRKTTYSPQVRGS